MIVNHCEKVLLNSFLYFKGQGLKADTNVFRTDGQSDHYRAFVTMWRGPDNLLHVFFNINVPFGSDYFVLISQHNCFLFEDVSIRNDPKLGLTLTGRVIT
jgi:hypothetical protein